ncbi:hypothetical protein AAFF_G00011900 [Aldrovandia affinis]|uniref:Uncharacterized protein n=1 Tax=Aldrovandia affinis TaxID=143900 RepID=A0AAD7WH76_9TELE|nr:hypothetical protein AAFF_G00011900 [Aldrovandia affinis]
MTPKRKNDTEFIHTSQCATFKSLHRRLCVPILLKEDNRTQGAEKKLDIFATVKRPTFPGFCNGETSREQDGNIPPLTPERPERRNPPVFNGEGLLMELSLTLTEISEGVKGGVGDRASLSLPGADEQITFAVDPRCHVSGAQIRGGAPNTALIAVM